MADAYSQTISGEVATTLGANARKTTHDTFNYGTPRIYPIVVNRNAGNWNDYADSNSDFHKVMAVIQTRCEIYGIGEIDPTTSQFTLLVNLNTLVQDTNDYDDVPNITDTISILGTEIQNATGIAVNVENGKIVNGSLLSDC